MLKNSRSMVFSLAVLGLALVASPAFAANTFTINETDVTGVAGSEKFVPTFLSMADPNGIGGTATNGGIYIPYIGTVTTCTAFVGSDNGDCSGWGSVSLQAWANGVYYDPRFGTPFIPPSGDHHRTGYRMLMQPSFSGGMWLSGFAPLAQRFPFFPETGTAGPGGDVGLALADASFEAGVNQILHFVDAHGEPLTTGKFPRYWAHTREAWIDQLVVKYTAGGGTGLDEDLFAQSLRSQMEFTRNLNVRWRAMSPIDGAFSLGGPGGECGGWCEFYIIDGGTPGDFTDLHLYVVTGTDANTNTADEASGASVFEITTVTKLDTMGALVNGGEVLGTYTLSDLEKLPAMIDQRAAQVVYEAGQPGDFDQSLVYQWRVYSGPNVHAEEGPDPYSFIVCGTRGHEYGEEDCADSAHGGAIDSANVGLDTNGVLMALVYNSNFPGTLADSVLVRLGRDLNPSKYDGGVGGAAAFTLDGSGDPSQDTGVYVACTNEVAAGTLLTVSGVAYLTDSCESDPGADGMFGTFDDGTIYYKEALENGLRGWVRENNAHAFSFLGADEDGVGGNTPNFGLTQLVQQREITQGYLMSCINCSPHNLPANVNTVTYEFQWPELPEVVGIAHPPNASPGANTVDGITTITLPVLP